MDPTQTPSNLAPGAPPVDVQDTDQGQPSADTRTYDHEYVSKLRSEAAERRVREKELAAKLAEYEKAESDRAEQSARKRGDFEKVEKSYIDRLAKAEADAAAYRNVVVERIKAQAVDTAIAAAGIPADLAPMVRAHIAQSVAVDPETLEVSGDFADEIKRLAPRLGGSVVDSDAPARVLPAIPGTRPSQAEPENVREAIQQDVARMMRGLR